MIRALWALLCLIALVLPLWLRGELVVRYAHRVRAQGQDLEGLMRERRGEYLVVVGAHADYREEVATFVHELYHVAQRHTERVAPVAALPLPEDVLERIRAAASLDYPANRVAHEVAAEAFARSIVRHLLGSGPR